MSDIDMCDNDECECRQYCHRFTAKPDADQHYTPFELPTDGSRCDGFWSNRQYLTRHEVIYARSCFIRAGSQFDAQRGFF